MGIFHDLSEELFSMNGWSLRAQDNRNLVEGESYVVHECPGKSRVSAVYVYPDVYSNCWRCQEPLPDEVRALWIMHNGII